MADSLHKEVTVVDGADQAPMLTADIIGVDMWLASRRLMQGRVLAGASAVIRGDASTMLHAVHDSFINVL